MKKISGTLIVVDIQADFCPGGALAVPGGNEIVPLVNRIMEKFQNIAATQDWHPEDHVSFAANHPGKKPFDSIEIGGGTQTLWPRHCVMGTPGAMFHRDLETVRFNLIIRKGHRAGIDSYSAFRENDRETVTGLHGYLEALGSREVWLCGLATDYCVHSSAMDAVAYGFRTAVIIDACRGIDVPAGSMGKTIDIMKDAGVRIIHSDEL